MNDEKRVTLVVGLQCGNEGKNRVLHYELKDAKYLVRSGWRNNIEDAIVINGKTYLLHILPSSVLNDNVISMIGPGVAIDLKILLEEIKMLKKAGVEITPSKLIISDKANVILPYHKAEDMWFESQIKNKTETSKSGFGPCHADKFNGIGIKMCDLFDKKNLKKKIQEAVSTKSRELFPRTVPMSKIIDGMAEEYSFETSNDSEYVKLSEHIGDTTTLINGYIMLDENVLVDASETTSSNVSESLASAEIAPTHVKDVIGVIKAYSYTSDEKTFLTEMSNDLSDRIRNLSGEQDSTRCGALDLVSVKKACILNGITQLCVNRIDVIGKAFQNEKIPVCIAYFPNKEKKSSQPVPYYTYFKGGWNTEGITNYHDLPYQCRMYIQFIEKYLGIPVKYIGVGSDNDRTIIKEIKE